ncbi:MAG: hydrogenase maturation protease [Spirochaetes bacterium]|nr:hydrogenase maturation protease [Spirochaetota bacterium]
MEEVLNKIKERIEGSKDKKILFFCIGNIIRGDDGVGEYIFHRLPEKENIFRINAGNAPVNFIGKVETLSPDIVIIIDCMAAGKDPGSITFTNSSQIYSSPIDTHSGLINEFIKGIKPSPDWYIIGIQPYSLTDIDKLSDEVKVSADKLIQLFHEVV